MSIKHWNTSQEFMQQEAWLPSVGVGVAKVDTRLAITWISID